MVSASSWISRDSPDSAVDILPACSIPSVSFNSLAVMGVPTNSSDRSVYSLPICKIV